MCYVIITLRNRNSKRRGRGSSRRRSRLIFLNNKIVGVAGVVVNVVDNSGVIEGDNRIVI